MSFALLAYRWISAIRAIRSGSITRSYLDPLAVRVQCFRVFTREGRGWKRFLVFAELTKSKKGAEYVALYSYFSFESWMNTVFADGPRQVLNAITLWSVMQADLIPGGEHAPKDNGNGEVWQFFNNVRILAEENNLQAVVLFGMLFTLIIWVLSVLKLASAVVLYLIFLFHHIPSTDGSLKAYCRRKISTRLTRIVRKKVDKALANGFKLQNRAPTQPTVGGGAAKPTLPSLPNVGLEKPMATPTLSRSTTQTTLPPYTRSNTAAVDKPPTLPNLELDSKPPLTRTVTQSSAMSDSASFLEPAATATYSPLDHQTASLPPVPPLPPVLPTSKTPVSQWRQPPGPSPVPREFGSGTPGPGMRNLTDSGPRPFSPYGHGHGHGHGGDALNRSRTPGASVNEGAFDLHPTRVASPARYDPYGTPAGYYGAPPEDDYQDDQSFATPNGTMRPSRALTGPSPREYDHQAQWSAQPSPAESRPEMNQGFADRSMTPASGVVRPPPGRSMTPATQRNTPGPQLPNQAHGPQRTYTPFNPAVQGNSEPGYRAFSPALDTSVPSPVTSPDRQHGYQAFSPLSRGNSSTPAGQGNALSENQTFGLRSDATQYDSASPDHSHSGYRTFSPLSRGPNTVPTDQNSSELSNVALASSAHAFNPRSGSPGHLQADDQAFDPSLDSVQSSSVNNGYAEFKFSSDAMNPGSTSHGYAQPGYRAFSPVSTSNNTPSAGPGHHQPIYQAFSPASSNDPAGYHNPPPISHSPQSYVQNPPHPSGFQPFSRAQTTSPSTMNGHRHYPRGAPPEYGFTRSHTSHR